jgi:chaperonin GroEL (HSP60 family)
MPIPIVVPAIAAGVGALARNAAKKAVTKGMSKTAKKEAAKKAAQDAREEALKNAKTDVKDGVKETSYPYVDPKKAGDIRDFASPTSSSRNAPRLSDESLDYAGFKKGGKVSSASSRADGCAQRGKTRGKMI